MARFEFKLPDIGEGVAEGEVVAWHVKPGDAVKEDQAMVEVMTDKATVTIGAPKKGTILETHATVGQIMPVGSLLVVIETADAAASSAGAIASPAAARASAAPSRAPVQAAPAASARASSAASPPMSSGASASSDGPAATAVGDIRDTVPGATFFGTHKRAPAPSEARMTIPDPPPPDRTNGGHVPVASSAARSSDHFDERPLATPVVRKLARDLGVDLRRVRPTGDGNRVTIADVRGFQTPVAAPASTSGRAAAGHGGAPGTLGGRAPVSIVVPPGTHQTGEPLEDRRPFVGVRRKIAERMQVSTNTAAHFTFVEECDVGRLKDLRSRLKPFAEEKGVKLTFLPFIVKAVVAALKKHPVLNCALDESTNELVYRKYVHVGIAASTDQGLMVPVVKDADRKSILEIAREIDRLGAAAKAGTIASADLQGSGFTITSLGSQGGLFATPILNFPEVGILGVHQIKQKPVVRDGQIVIGEIMLLSLSFDHRIVDGHVGAAFAYDIIALLEEPGALMLEMT